MIEEQDEGPPYNGPFVTLRADGALYTVNIEPQLSDGLERSRSYACKSAAWGYARELWQVTRLPFVDYAEGKTGRDQAETWPRKNSVRSEAQQAEKIRGKEF